MKLPAAVGERYQRLAEHALLDVGVLRGSRLLVAGCGALGNEVLKGLAMLGIGRLIVIDPDMVETSNLTRSILFRAADAGRPKAEVAAERIREINPDVEVKAIVGRVEADIGLGMLRRCQAVLGCLDSREARLRLNRLCWMAGAPLIDGGLAERTCFGGSVRTFLSPAGPCYGCTLSRQAWSAIAQRHSCGRGPTAEPSDGVPTTPIEASIVGAMQVQQALKILHKLPLAGGEGYFYNGLTCELLVVRYERDAVCPCHEEAAVSDLVLHLTEDVGQIGADMLLQRAREACGKDAVVRFMHSVVEALCCRRCGRCQEVQWLAAKLDPLHWLCPDCGGRRHARLRYVLDREGQLGKHTLAELGFPPLSGGFVESNGKEAYWECTGGEDPFWQPD